MGTATRFFFVACEFVILDDLSRGAPRFLNYAPLAVYRVLGLSPRIQRELNRMCLERGTDVGGECSIGQRLENLVFRSVYT